MTQPARKMCAVRCSPHETPTRPAARRPRRRPLPGRRERRRRARRRHLDPGHDPVVRRREAARRHPAPQGRDREDAGDPLDRPVLQPRRPDRPGRPRGGDVVRPGRPVDGPVGPLPRLRGGREADGARLHVHDGRPARVRRLDRLPRLGRTRRAVRRRQRGPVGGLAAVVDRQGRHVRQVLRRRHRPDRRRQAAGRPRRRRLPGAGLRPLPLPLRRRDAAHERVPHARAVRPDRRHAGPDHRRPELQRRRRERHPAPRLPGRQLRRPGRQRRPRLGVLEGAEPDPGRHRLGRAAVPHAGADGEQHGRRRHRPVPAEPHRLRARLARPVGARARQRDRRERPPEDGPRRLVRRGHAVLRPVPQGRRADGRRPADRGPDQRRQVARRAELAAGRLDGVHDAAALRHLHRRRHRQRDRRRRGDGRLDDLAAAGARRPPVGLRERQGRT